MPGDHGRKTGEEGGKCKQSQQRKKAKAERQDQSNQANTHDETKSGQTKSQTMNQTNSKALNKSEKHKKNRNSDQKNLSAESKQPQASVSSSEKRAGSTKNIKQSKQHGDEKPPVYGALDLGTNNCRLLLARPNQMGFQIVDAFSRIIRLGEGVSETSALSKDAMSRTIDALQVCSAKLAFHKVSRARLVATQACRAAENSLHFLENVANQTGLDLEIICQETEAKLAVSGCVPLINSECDYALIFDIGGGSSELIWIDAKKIKTDQSQNYIDAEDAIVSWISLPVGVVTLAEKFGGKHVNKDIFAKMVAYVQAMLVDFAQHISATTDINQSKIHYLGTSGTVTTLAGVHLCLDSYDRQKIDGIWMHTDEVADVSKRLMNLNFNERAAIPSIGRERADLVMGGCAILEAMLQTWPSTQLRVADRGLREGILAKLMAEDGFIKPGQSWTSQPKRSSVRSRHRNPNRAPYRTSHRSRRPLR